MGVQGSDRDGTAPRLQALVEALCADIVRAVCDATLAEVSSRLGVSAAPAGAMRGARASSPTSPMALDHTRARVVLDRLIAERNLSPREGQILSAAVHGVPRKYIPRVIGVGESTIKTQTRKLLRKLGHASVDDAVWHVRTLIDGAR